MVEQAETGLVSSVGTFPEQQPKTVEILLATATALVLSGMVYLTFFDGSAGI